MSHHNEDIFENRKQFQLERMILFSDAVFAIVITLLVIEIKVPEAEPGIAMTSHELSLKLMQQIPHYFGFIFSFVITGTFWQTHHRIFGYVNNYDGSLIWLNLFLLMAVCGLPFTTSLLSTYGAFNLTYIIYSINLGLIGLMSYFIWMRISNPKHNLSAGLIDEKLRKFGKVRSLTIALIFFSGAVLSMFNITILALLSRFIFFLIFPAMVILRKIYKTENRR